MSNRLSIRRQGRAALLAAALLTAGLGCATAAHAGGPPSTVTSDIVLVEPTSGPPWGVTEHRTAMDLAFGEDKWELRHFESVEAGTGDGGLFSDDVDFVFLDGAFDGEAALMAFLQANSAALHTYLDRGGNVLVSAAVGDRLDEDFVVEGVTTATTTSPNHVTAVNPFHAIFKGPQLPAPWTISGSPAASGVITGAVVAPLMTGTSGDTAHGWMDIAKPVLVQKAVGNGHLVVMTLTPPSHATDDDGSMNLRVNILVDAKKKRVQPTPCPSGSGFVPDCAAPTPPVDTPRADTTKPSAKIAGLPTSCVRKSFTVKVTLRDGESGLGEAVVRRNRTAVRQIAASGAKAKTVEVRIPIAKRTPKRGTNRVRVAVRDMAGNRDVKVAKFTRCGAPTRR